MAILGPSTMERIHQNHLSIPGRYHPIEAILMKRKKVIVQILRNLHFSVKKGKNCPWGGSFKGPWGTFRVIQQEQSGLRVGRPHPLEAIFKKRRQVIKPILRNQHFRVTTCKNGKFVVFKGPWGTHGAIQTEPSYYTR